MYQFKYTLNDNDYFEFNKYHLSNAPVNKKGLIVLRIMIPVIYILFLLLSLIDVENFNEYVFIGQAVVCIIVSLAWFFLVKPLYTFLLKINIKLMKKYGKLPYGKDVLICFDEEFLIETTEKSESKIKYTSIERIVGANSAIYIYLNAVQAVIVPLSAFESEKIRDDFWDFIHYKWNAAKELTS